MLCETDTSPATRGMRQAGRRTATEEKQKMDVWPGRELSSQGSDGCVLYVGGSRSENIRKYFIVLLKYLKNTYGKRLSSQVWPIAEAGVGT